jgi:hypothetical protein
MGELVELDLDLNGIDPFGSAHKPTTEASQFVSRGCFITPVLATRMIAAESHSPLELGAGMASFMLSACHIAQPCIQHLAPLTILDNEKTKPEPW